MRKRIRNVCKKSPRVFVIGGTILFATVGFVVSYKISECLSFARQTCLHTGEYVGGISGLAAHVCLLLCLLREGKEKE